MTERTRLSLRQARAIDAVAKARGIDQATHALNMSQPVISRLISSAESLLGVRLFQRGWSGAEPTASGESILERCTAALDLIVKAEDDIAFVGGVRPNLRNFVRWHHLDAVAAVVRYGSASAASIHLGITQPAITRSIAAISDYSRQPLFDRKRNGFGAAAAAQRLAALRDELLQALGTVEDFKLNLRPGLIGRLAVGMLPFSGQSFVAETFGELTNRFPDLRLMAVPGSYNMLSEALRRGELECMVGILRSPAPFPDLEEIALSNERFTLVARYDHPCHKGPQSISELKNESWIVAPRGTPVRSYFEKLFQAAGARPPAQTCEILSFGNAEEVIMNSNSIGMLSYSELRIASLPPRLRRVDVDLPDNEIAIGLTVRKAGGASDVLKVFERLLRQRYSQISDGANRAGLGDEPDA